MVDRTLALVARVEPRLSSTRGEDTEGRTYTSIADMWVAELGERGQRIPVWYGKGDEYWEADAVPATIDGVLGGFAELHDPDVRASLALLAAVREARPELQWRRALDCGAGVGRVTKHVLLERFEAVEAVEPSRKLMAALRVYVGAQLMPRVPRTACCGMQEMGAQVYGSGGGEAGDGFDVIWAQWVVGHLTDGDFVEWIQLSLAALAPGGVLVLKENVCAPIAFVVDKDDSSLTRSREYFVALFEEAGAVLFAEQLQPDFPEGMYAVISFVLTAQQE